MKIAFVLLVTILFITKLILSTNINLDIVKPDITYNLDPNQVSICTYNIQSLPYMTKSYESLSKMLSKYDVILIQEAFNGIVDIGNRDRLIKNLYKEGFTSIISSPEPNIFSMKFVNSGLLIMSKYKIEYVDFIPFNLLYYSDSLSDKGILVGKINGIYIINTHLQAIYDKKTEQIVWDQLSLLNSYINTLPKDSKVVFGGDFNINLFKSNNISKFTNLFKTFSVNLSTDATFEKTGEKLDYVIYRGVNGYNFKVNKFNNYSDHNGLSGILKLK